MDEAHESRYLAEIEGSSLIVPELVQEMTDKVVLVKEKHKAVMDRQKSYVDYRPYRLRLPEELNSEHDTFHVSNLKKCLADANLHVPLEKIKVDKTLCFVEEPVEIMDREIKKLKRRKIALVKVRWNSKRGPEFTWKHEDQMRIKNWKLRFEHSGIHGLFSGRNCCLVRRITCGYPWPELEGKRFGEAISDSDLEVALMREFLNPKKKREIELWLEDNRIIDSLNGSDEIEYFDAFPPGGN
ncbi:hypothetical protein Tco_1003739 [Tanacetum coccineum]|uniref:Reverse transcriptase domain-containing protein n=1 Tax=Tanacetum coccineum TaxID=301880 RepID=A0ABQ5FAA7_9ASTR